jgi:hypothetical protein
MGGQLAAKVSELWWDLPHPHFKLLVHMAVTALDPGQAGDGREPEIYFRSRRAMIAAVYGRRALTPAETSKYASRDRAVRDYISELKKPLSEGGKYGAIREVKHAARWRADGSAATHYKLQLDRPTEGSTAPLLDDSTEGSTAPLLKESPDPTGGSTAPPTEGSTAPQQRGPQPLHRNKEEQKRGENVQPLDGDSLNPKTDSLVTSATHQSIPSSRPRARGDLNDDRKSEKNQDQKRRDDKAAARAAQHHRRQGPRCRLCNEPVHKCQGKKARRDPGHNGHDFWPRPSVLVFADGSRWAILDRCPECSQSQAHRPDCPLLGCFPAVRWTEEYDDGHNFEWVLPGNPPIAAASLN